MRATPGKAVIEGLLIIKVKIYGSTRLCAQPRQLRDMNIVIQRGSGKPNGGSSLAQTSLASALLRWIRHASHGAQPIRSVGRCQQTLSVGEYHTVATAHNCVPAATVDLRSMYCVQTAKLAPTIRR